MGRRWGVALSAVERVVRQAGPTDATALREAHPGPGVVLASLPESTRLLPRVMTGGNP